MLGGEFTAMVRVRWSEVSLRPVFNCSLSCDEFNDFNFLVYYDLSVNSVSI